MDWINCNSCFRQPRENENTFSLTSCGHIFCESCGCFVAGTLDCCKKCGNKCLSILIGEKLFETNPEIREYFQDVEKKCEEMVQVMKFQNIHRMKLAKNHQSVISKYNKAKLYIKKLENELVLAKNTLRNKARALQKPYSVPVENQSMMSTSSFYSNEKLADTASKFQYSSGLKHKTPSIKQRKLSFQSDLSLSSTENYESGIRASSSSSYSSTPQQNYDNYMRTLGKVQFNLYENRQSRRE